VGGDHILELIFSAKAFEPRRRAHTENRNIIMAKSVQALCAGCSLLIAGCTTTLESAPPRTATEQLLISTAAERAAGQMLAPFPADTKFFVDAQYFEGTDSKYTISAIRDQLGKDGAHLVADRGTADLVVEIRSGAQSIDQTSTLVGVPSLDVPVPLSGGFKIPEIALFKKAQRIGTAKVAMTGFDQKDGTYKFTVGPDLGYSHQVQWTVLLFISWSSDDLGQ
jgi:hypothetical protein